MVGHGTDKVRAPDVFLELQSGVVVPASLTALISVVPAAEAGSGGERFDEFSCLVQCFRNQGIVSVLGGAVLDIFKDLIILFRALFTVLSFLFVGFATFFEITSKGTAYE